MEYRRLGRTDLNVSALCLGTMTWGKQNTQEEGFAQMDLAVEHGINFFDTAEMYAVPTSADTAGKTEEIIGNWFARSGRRQDIILATKAAGPGDWISHIRGGPRLNRQHLEEAVEGSLRRLQTDVIDLYQLHWPERSTNFFGRLGYKHRQDDAAVPIEETIEVLDGLVKAGKIRHYGLSNETAWGTMKYVMEAERLGAPRPVSIQNPYSLLNRSFEVGLAEVAHREDIGLLAYSPLAFGMLSGKYRNDTWPEAARLTLFKQFSRYTNPQAAAATEKYCQLAEAHGLNPAQLALQYVTSRPFVTSNIIGATDLTQLETNLRSIEVPLDKTLEKALEAIHAEHPYPAP
ncbi:aldo/keto reductase [Alcanivorax sp. JB21]|uniref:aldo/keto reductase n=1 Tax=Alcanivorax limicola TaxID=2874102 RepID=UPI001CBF3DD4|nr:aldo/keto reductase [Alcanivorax limicola]MBZ2189639.1 aldo/keto reductase [Alcanivorax limicola]